jgi:hypothetical protein
MDGGSMAGWCLFVATAIADGDLVDVVAQPVELPAAGDVHGDGDQRGQSGHRGHGHVHRRDNRRGARRRRARRRARSSATTSTLTVGDHDIVASYSASLDFAASEDALTHLVEVIADAGGPYPIGEGDALTLDATASVTGPAATYTWDVNDDGTFGDATGATPTLTWAALEALGITNGGGPATPITVQVTERRRRPPPKPP